MPLDPELVQAVETWYDRIQYDNNRPYTIRRKATGAKDSRGQAESGGPYETRTISNMRTQPLDDKDYARLPEGMRETSWIFIEVVAETPGEVPSDPDEFLDFGDQIKLKNHWWEVKFINDWDIIQGCKAVFVE